MNENAPKNKNERKQPCILLGNSASPGHEASFEPVARAIGVSAFARSPLSNRGATSGCASATRFLANADGGSSVSASGFWTSSFLDKLDDFKETLRSSDSQRGKFGRWGDYILYVYQHGKGSSRGGQPAAYIVDLELSGGLAFKFYFNRCQKKGVPNVFVQIHYSQLRVENIFESIGRVRSILADWGFTIERLTISRLDVNVTAALPMQYFVEALQSGRVYLSARSYRLWNKYGALESFESGTRGESIVLRVYDKIKELQAHFDAVKIEDLQNQFRDCQDVLRFEFELCRDVLRRFDIVDENDLVDNLATLLDWATKKAFRIEARRRADRHEKNIVFDSVFEKIRAAFLAFGHGLEACIVDDSDNVSYVRFRSVRSSAPPVRVKVRIRRRSSSLVKAGLSTLTTALSRYSTRPLDRNKFLRVCFEVIYKQADRLYSRYTERFQCPIMS